ncbi:hypothetical protein ACGFIF_00525 [Kribbella sp. NPDC049174]|uniref:hypothetical protein n=1 Tax=Kribbella sp. NPDC049174 TaxID=3364112 RepID=UPI00371A2A7B
MRAYRAAWLGFCGVVGLMGGLAAFTLPPPTVILLFLLAAITGGVVAMIALIPADNTPIARDRWPTVAWSGVVAGAGTVAFVSLGTLLGAPMAVLMLVLIAGGSPYVARRWFGRLREHEHRPSPGHPDAHQAIPARTAMSLEPEPVDEAAELSDDALVLAWRASFSALQRATSPAERLRIVDARRAYLDELERRNPSGVAAWLASGARAAGNPTRFVAGDGAPGHARIDWDRLIQGTDR